MHLIVKLMSSISINTNVLLYIFVVVLLFTLIFVYLKYFILCLDPSPSPTTIYCSRNITQYEAHTTQLSTTNNIQAQQIQNYPTDCFWFSSEHIHFELQWKSCGVERIENSGVC